MPRDDAYLLDILLMAKDALSFIEGMNKDSFLSDQKCQYAVVRCFEVIGEASKRISEDLKTKHPNIPWSAMARMRDLLIHAYSKVDLNKVWDTIQNDIPGLVATLEQIVPSEEKP